MHTEFRYQILNQKDVPARSVYAIGRNYVNHINELKNEIPTEPVVFLKSQGALAHIENKTSEIYAFRSEGLHYEAELVVMIGDSIELGATGSWDQVYAVGLGLDLTRRSVQTRLKEKGLPWTIAKSFAGSAVVTPFLLKESFHDLNSIRFEFIVNNTIKQTGYTDHMIYKIPTIITYLASLHQLIPGDIIYTGTPEGVGPLKSGDQITLKFTELNIEFSGRF